MENSELYRVYEQGRKNKIASSPIAANSKLRKIKVIAYYLLMMIVCPSCKVDSEVTYVNGDCKKYRDIEDDTRQRIYRGYLYRHINDIKEYKTFWSGISYFTRIRVIFNAICLYMKNPFKNKELASWIEFYIIYCFLNENNITKIVTRGHYDDVNTWFGEFSKLFHFSLVLYQHGIVLSNIKIPHKIFYSEANVFDEYSKTVFEKHYISNPKCRYSVYDFKASCDFSDIPNKQSDVLYIGIGEQCNPDWVELILNLIESVFGNKNYQCYIMLHPNSTHAYHGVHVACTREKYSDLDVLITEFSTLPLDFFRVKSRTKIIYTKDVDCFHDYPFCFCKNNDSLKKELETIGSKIL